MLKDFYQIIYKAVFKKVANLTESHINIKEM